MTEDTAPPPTDELAATDAPADQPQPPAAPIQPITLTAVLPDGTNVLVDVAPPPLDWFTHCVPGMLLVMPVLAVAESRARHAPEPEPVQLADGG